MTDPKLRVLISSEQIQARIKELGEQISKDYPVGNLHMICILKGATFFMTDLARAMKRDVFVDFMGISTYGKGKTSSGEVSRSKVP
jgi:hypoxanthine phosphoribosyltransferase